MVFLLAFLGSLLLPTVAGKCLANATDPATRKHLVNPITGETYPVGITMGDWAAAQATSRMVGILMEEMLGFNVSYTEHVGQVACFLSVAGCKTPAEDDPGCGPDGPNVTYQHFQMEAWMGVFPNIEAQISRYQTAFKLLDNGMGYTGLESQYFTRREMDAAYEAEGLALDFWNGFDVNWYEPWKYFDNPTAVNTSELKLCSETNLNNDVIMSGYLRASGDTAGVIVGADGKVVANCPDGHFWLSPACRSDITKCVLYFTAGPGYGVAAMLQKATKWNMPLAVSTAKTWGGYIELSKKHKSTFYWWTPDPTFLDVDAVYSVFPPHDKEAWAAGDISTAPSDVPLGKVVSHDLQALAPRLESFLENVNLDIDTINKLLLEQSTTGESWDSLICTWLKENEQTWMPWLPDDTQCFPKFGLYSEITQQFVDNRDNKEGISCRACPSGTYSQQLNDGDITYICVACPAGTSQPSGATLACEPCLKGEYQDLTGQQSCKRCELNFYQDEEGGPQCKQCPANSGTLQVGSLEFADCGCKLGYIDVANQTGNLTCAECQEGLSCPAMGTLTSLLTGSHPLGTDYLPEVNRGFYVTEQQALEVYRCSSVAMCPGGLPAQCGGGLVGVPCGECPPGYTMDSDVCEVCRDELITLWAVGTVCVFLFLTAAYYLMTSKVTAKASVLFTTTCAFGMLVSLLQSIGIIGTMTVDFPVDVDGVFSWFSILLLDLDNFGFACLAGSNTSLRYLASVLFFPAGIAWFAMNYGVSRFFPRHKWDITKVASCMGQFLQVGFSTMSATALIPLTCYTHPNMMQSLLKYPNVICGTQEHSWMLAIGVSLLVIGVFGFLTLCTYAAYRVPMWSATEQHGKVRAFRFLVFRFRLDSWWFGVPLLCRGPLIALPIVLATDYPAIQTVWVTFILLAFLACQAMAWPWKVPLLNALDCWMSYCIMILVAASALYLEPINKVGVVADFVDTFNTGIMVVIFSSIGLMILMAFSALFHRAAMGGNAEYAIFNLGRTMKPDVLATKLKEMAELLAQMEDQDIERAFETLAVFDTRRITKFMTLMSTEVFVGRSDLAYGTRVSSASFQPKAKADRTSRTSRTSRASAISKMSGASGTSKNDNETPESAVEVITIEEPKAKEVSQVERAQV